MTGPSSWQAARYPVTLTCTFCQQTLTIALDGDGPSTVTTGHATWCIQVPKSRRTPARQESAA